MTIFSALPTSGLQQLRARVQAEYDRFRAKGRRLDMSRGKPAPEQLDLSNDILKLPGSDGGHQADGGDTRNYYGSIQGLLEARALFSGVLGAPIDQILIANNSSLGLMHDCVVFALLKGVPDGIEPWNGGRPTFLCPAPGYDELSPNLGDAWDQAAA